MSPPRVSRSSKVGFRLGSMPLMVGNPSRAAKSPSRMVKTGTSPARAGSLVIELAARTAIVDGKRVELPPTEFALLAALAARPGEVISHKSLIEAAFPDSEWMSSVDLHWRIWNVRKLIGDQDREHKIVGNRRGVGYFIDLPPAAVDVLEGVADGAIRLDEPAEAPAEAPADSTVTIEQASTSVAETDGALEPAMQAQIPQRRPSVRPAAVLVAATVAVSLLGGSWAAGSWLSQRGRATHSAPQDSTAGTVTVPGETKPERTNKKRHQEKGGDNKARSSSGAFTAAAPSANTSTATNQQTKTGSKTGSGQDQQPAPPPPPQPDAQLYHLYNPDSGDHYMTTISSTANQKQAAGYQLSTEGRVFSEHEEGTVAITLDSGTAFVYRDSDSAPRGIDVTTLYRLTKDGDFFYSTSTSQANEAQADGWARSTVGYVAV